MNRQTTIKMALALGGIVAFGASVRLNIGALRWVAIALVAAAVLVRFWRVPPGSG